MLSRVIYKHHEAGGLVHDIILHLQLGLRILRIKTWVYAKNVELMRTAYAKSGTQS